MEFVPSIKITNAAKPAQEVSIVDANKLDLMMESLALARLRLFFMQLFLLVKRHRELSAV